MTDLATHIISGFREDKMPAKGPNLPYVLLKYIFVSLGKEAVGAR